MGSTEDIKDTIRRAFANVPNEGVGVREAIAIDDYADEAVREAARLKDIEEHWWDITPEWRPSLGTALSFTDVAGFRFLLPAAMTAALDQVQGDIGNSVFFHLVLLNKGSAEGRPHHGYPEYISFLERISARDNASYYGFEAAHISAIAEFLNWYTRSEGSHLYTDRAKEIESKTRLNKLLLEKVPRENYRLSLDDEMAIFDEECRIVQDWLELGNVQGR